MFLVMEGIDQNVAFELARCAKSNFVHTFFDYILQLITLTYQTFFTENVYNTLYQCVTACTNAGKKEREIDFF